jgi:cysteine-rich repeat protein
MLLALACACGPSIVLDDGTTGVVADESSGSAGDVVSFTASDTLVTTGVGDTDPNGMADATGIPPAVCGDGIVADGESCDDANLDPYDGCNADCRVPGEVLFRVQLDGDEITGLLGAGDTVFASTNTYGFGAPRDLSTAYVYGLGEDGAALWSWSDSGITAFDGAVALRAEGGVHVLGIDLPGRGAPEQPYVRAFSPDGRIAWTTALDDSLGQLFAHPDGGAYVVNTMVGDATSTVLRLDAAGAPAWQPIELMETLHALTVMPGGELVVYAHANAELTAIADDGSIAWSAPQPASVVRGWVREDTLEIFVANDAQTLVEYTLDGMQIGEREVTAYGLERVPGGGYVAIVEGQIVRWDDDLQERWQVETDFASFQEDVEPTRLLLGSMIPDSVPAREPPEILAVAI